MNTELVRGPLSGSAYFRCERFSCTLLKSSCVLRRQDVKHSSQHDPGIATSCEGCVQGDEIAQEIGSLKEVLTKNLKAKIIKGDKCIMEEPRVKDASMDILTKECTTCGKTKSLEEFSINKQGRLGRAPICKECKKKYNERYYRASKKKQAAGEPTSGGANTSADRQEKQNERPVVNYHQSDFSPAEAVVALNFSGHENVLQWLKRAAAENFRNPDQQILFVLHQMAAAGAAV